MKTNYIRKIFTLVSCTFTVLLLMQCKKDMGISTETGEPGTVIITVGGVSDYENQITKLGSLSPTNSGNTSTTVDSDMKKVNDGVYMTTSSSVQAMESILEKPILTPSDLTDKVNAKYAATTSPMLNEKYYRIIFKKRNSQDTVISRISQAGQELRLTLDVGATYDWYAYSYNDVNSSDLEATDLTAIRIKENNDLLWATNTLTIVNTDEVNRVNITFAHKVAKLSFEVDATTLFGDIDEFEAELVSIGNLTSDQQLSEFFSSGYLNVLSGAITSDKSNSSTFDRNLKYIKSDPNAKIARVNGFYTINSSDISGNNKVVIKITNATRKKWYRQGAASNILSASNMNTNLTFEFKKYLLAAGVNHITKITFNSTYPGMDWAIVDSVDYEHDRLMSIPMSGAHVWYDYGPYVSPFQEERFNSFAGTPSSFYDLFFDSNPSISIYDRYEYLKKNRNIFDLSSRLFLENYFNIQLAYTKSVLTQNRSEDYNWGYHDEPYRMTPVTVNYLFDGGKKPDIITLSTNMYEPTRSEITQLTQYVKNGGVLLLFLDKGTLKADFYDHYNPFYWRNFNRYSKADLAFEPLFKELFGSTAKVNRFQDTPKDSRFIYDEYGPDQYGEGTIRSVDKSAYYTSVYKMNDRIKDEITDGYWGKTEGLYWGGMGQNSYVTGIPDNLVIDYSYAYASNHNLNNNLPYDARVMFRAKNYNLFVVCDATWMRTLYPVNPSHTIFTLQTQTSLINPFANAGFETSGKPKVADMKDPISGKDYRFANSILYANAFTWAMNIVRDQKDGAPPIRPVQ